MTRSQEAPRRRLHPMVLLWCVFSGFASALAGLGLLFWAWLWWSQPGQNAGTAIFAMGIVLLAGEQLVASLLAWITILSRRWVLVVPQALLAMTPMALAAAVVVDDELTHVRHVQEANRCEERAPGPDPPVAVDVVCGDEHCAALLEDGTISGWWWVRQPMYLRQPMRQLGTGPWVPELRPDGPSAPRTWRRDGASLDASRQGPVCFVTVAGQVVCRGASAITGAVAVSSGHRHGCALRSDGSVVCFGESLKSYGRGSGLEEIEGIPPMVALASGWQFSCGLTSDGEVWCWGNNFRGSLGGPPVQEFRPAARVPGVSDVVAIRADLNLVCATRADRSESCWGEPGSAERVRGGGIDAICELHQGGVRCRDARDETSGWQTIEGLPGPPVQTGVRARQWCPSDEG